MAERLYPAFESSYGGGRKVPSTSVNERHSDVLTASMLKRQYKREAAHLGHGTGRLPPRQSSEYHEKASIDPTSLVRVGTHGRGARRFHESILKLEERRGPSVKRPALDPKDLFSGEHMMFSGSSPTSAVSSLIKPKDMNPDYSSSSSHDTFKHPKSIRERTHQMLVQEAQRTRQKLADLDSIAGTSAGAHTSGAEEMQDTALVSRGRATGGVVRRRPQLAALGGTGFSWKAHTSHNRDFSSQGGDLATMVDLQASAARPPASGPSPKRNHKYSELTRSIALPHNSLMASLHPYADVSAT